MRINYFTQNSGSVNFYNPTSVFCACHIIDLHYLSVTVFVTLQLSDKGNDDGTDSYVCESSNEVDDQELVMSGKVW